MRIPIIYPIEKVRRSAGSAWRLGGGCLFLILLLTTVPVLRLWSWDSKPHSQIVDAALTVIPERDRLPQRLGEETWRLRYYVQMADWRDCLVSASDNWTIRSQNFGEVYTQFYANDYLLFPAAPSQIDHAPPGVLGAYRPFFLRALQALRTETPPNAARWIGSLLHFVTDSGSPPHALGIHGELHVKMESWLDASRMDLSGYKPQLLGKNDEEAVQGLVKRMNGLMEFSRLRAKRMLPFAKANDRVHVEPIGLECATETAKVTADVLHTLFTLAGQAPEGKGASLVAEVSAPPVAGMDRVPAKLMLLGTNYSTLSEMPADQSNAYQGSFWPSSSFIANSEKLVKESRAYRGSFIFRNLPPGTYQGIVERVGSRPLIVGPLVLRPGQTLHLSWQLKPGDPPRNLVRNPDFSTAWIAQGTPDHWTFEKLKGQWLSDNVPVDAGQIYRAGYEANAPATPTVKLQWMEAHWKPLNSQPVALPPTSTPPTSTRLMVPEKVVYARFIVEGAKSPPDSVRLVFLTRAR